MRGAASWIWHLSIDHLVSSDSSLRKFAKRDLFHADQELIVRIGLVPAAELLRFLALTCIPPFSPRFALSIEHTVTHCPRHSDLASKSLATRLNPQRA